MGCRWSEVQILSPRPISPLRQYTPALLVSLGPPTTKVAGVDAALPCAAPFGRLPPSHFIPDEMVKSSRPDQISLFDDSLHLFRLRLHRRPLKWSAWMRQARVPHPSGSLRLSRFAPDKAVKSSRPDQIFLLSDTIQPFWVRLGQWLGRSLCRNPMSQQPVASPLRFRGNRPDERILRDSPGKTVRTKLPKLSPDRMCLSATRHHSPA